MDGGGRLNDGFVGRVIEESVNGPVALIIPGRIAELDKSVDIFEGTYFGFDISFPPVRLSLTHTLFSFPDVSLCNSTTSVWFATTVPCLTAVMTRAIFNLESLC